LVNENNCKNFTQGYGRKLLPRFWAANLAAAHLAVGAFAILAAILAAAKLANDKSADYIKHAHGKHGRR